MVRKQFDTYFDTQKAALEYAYSKVPKEYMVIFPEHIWTEHVNYGTSVKYVLELNYFTGKKSRKCLHISLYRMSSGNYELTFYVN